MKDDETIDAYNKNVKKYVGMVSRAEPDADAKSFIEQLAPHSLVLDLGCGPGNSSRFFRDAGHKVDAVDASAEMVRIAKTEFDIDARVGTFDTITQIAHYGGVWANFSLLHAPKTEFPRYLKAIHRALKPGGIFHIGMKLGTGSHRDELGRLYTYYEKDELTDLIKGAGFDLIKIREGKTEGLAGTIDPWTIIQSKVTT